MKCTPLRLRLDWATTIPTCGRFCRYSITAMRCIGDAFSLCLLSDVVETGGAIGPACQSNAAQSVDVTCDVLVTQNANQNAKVIGSIRCLALGERTVEDL